MATLPPIVVDYPVLTDGNLDYLPGNSYQVISIEPKGIGNRRIRHRLEGKNLVRQLIENGQGVFSCAVVSTWSSYRSIETVKTETVELTENLVVAEQELNSQTRDYSSPTSFQPQVIATEDVSKLKLTQAHGVDEMLVGHEISIPKASRLAYAPYFRIESINHSILKIKEDQKLPKGCFEVSGVKESGFYFLIKMSTDLFEWIKNPGMAHKHQKSILCFALSQGLEILHNEYKEHKTWKEFTNLNYLYSHLKSIGAPLWDDDEFSPNKAVALWLPHEFDAYEDAESEF